MKFKTIGISNPEWDNYINSSINYDFHHTSCLHKIEVKDEEEALLFVAKAENDFIAFPLLIKPIRHTNYFDASSVYGYGGPVAPKAFSEIPKELNAFFRKQFLRHCIKNNIIAVFSRLHPLINTSRFFDQFGVVKKLNNVVVIDLTEPIDIQRQHYSRSYKNQINKLKKKKGYSVENLSKDNIDIFKDIYFETMDRVDAKDHYYFSNEYLKKLVSNNCFNSELLIAYDSEGQPTSAAIFTITNNIMQYHLGGTKDFAMHDTPFKYVMDEARLMGSNLGLKYFNLGGGVGGSDDDSLFKFKAGFSKNFFQFSVWNLVVNENVYDKLVKEKGVKKEDHPNFFPLYRAGN